MCFSNDEGAFVLMPSLGHQPSRQNYKLIFYSTVMLNSTVRLKPCTMFPPIYPDEYYCACVASHVTGVLQAQTRTPCCWNWNPSIWAKEPRLKAKNRKKKNKLFFSAGTLLIRHVLGPFLKGSTEWWRKWVTKKGRGIESRSWDETI